MRCLTLLFLPLALLTSGCATLPTLPSEQGVNVNDIVNATKCELASAVNPHNGPTLKDWSAKVSLDLRTVYDNSGGPTGAIVVPYYAGTVEAGGAIGASAQSNRVGHLGYVVAKLQDLKNAPCDPLEPTGLPFAPGDLGLGYWLNTAIASVSQSELDYVNLSELTYTLEFIIEQTASGAVRIRPTTGPTTGLAELGGKASSKYTHTLLVSLVPPPPKASGPTLVKIVDWPKLSTRPFIVDPATPPSNNAPQGGTSGERAPAISRRPATVEKRMRRPTIDPFSQQRLDDLQVKQRLFNSIAIPRSTLNAF